MNLAYDGRNQACSAQRQRQFAASRTPHRDRLAAAQIQPEHRVSTVLPELGTLVNEHARLGTAQA
jgi:hypothetical protein